MQDWRNGRVFNVSMAHTWLILAVLLHSILPGGDKLPWYRRLAVSAWPIAVGRIHRPRRPITAERTHRMLLLKLLASNVVKLTWRLMKANCGSARLASESPCTLSAPSPQLCTALPPRHPTTSFSALSPFAAVPCRYYASKARFDCDNGICIRSAFQSLSMRRSLQNVPPGGASRARGTKKQSRANSHF